MRCGTVVVSRSKVALLTHVPSQSDHARTMACEFCGKEFSHVSAIGDHVESSCPEKILPCDQAKNGCGWRGRRLSLKAHIDKCAYESIKGFFAIHDDRITRVSKDNERLRHKTEELEGVVRILKQELEWAKIALGPWYRPVYAERPPLATSCTRYPNDEGARVGPMLSRGTDTMTSDASDPERWVLDGTTEAFNFFDPFAFVGQTRNYDPDTHAGDNVSTTMIGTRAEQNLSTHTSHDGNTASESGTSNGLETIQDGAASVLGNNLQSTSTALFSYHFPSGNQVVFEEGGSSSRPQGWRHVLPPNSMPSNTGPGVQLPVSIPVSVTREQRVYRYSLITHTKQLWLLMNRTSHRSLDQFTPIWLRRIPFRVIDPSLRQVSTSTLLLHLTSALRLRDLWWVCESLWSRCRRLWSHKREGWNLHLVPKGFASAKKWVR